jgi:hypothetical protein
MSSRKRKQRPEFKTNHNRSNIVIHDDADKAEHGHGLDPSLFIQAYEAGVIRGPRASQAAESMEIFDYGTVTALPVRKIGDALIQWGENQPGKPSAFPGDEDELIGSSKLAVKPQNDEKNTVWVDRYVVSLELRQSLSVICYLESTHTL